MALHVALAGGSGFLGTQLAERLRSHGHRVTTLVRRPAQGSDESSWDPYAGTYDRDLVEAVDVVVNLAGSPLLGNPHSATYRRELRESRVTTTRVLARAIADSERRPAFLAGNGISYYGDHGSSPLTESADTRGHGLLTEVTRDWEDAARAASDAGARVCILRTAPVIDARSAPLKQLGAIFKVGLGGRLGSGKQHMPLISTRDWTAAVVHLAETDSVSGPVNLCSAVTPTNAEFTKSLGHAVHRPTIAAVPSVAMRAAMGSLAPMLLDSINAVPAALTASGFQHRDADVDAVIAAGLAKAD